MKLFPRARRFGSMEKKIQYLTLLPVELWIVILTEAVRPLWSLDTYCFSSNMEGYYHTIAKDGFRGVDERDHPLKARRSLRLVCKRFNDIVKTIPKAPDRDWILDQDNEPRSYRALPMPQWSASGHWERIDVRLDFEGPSTVIASYTPVTTFRLMVRRTSPRHDPLRYDSLHQMALVRHATNIISHPNTLKVLHLQLQHCYCIQPSEFTQCIETISHLRTLSLCLGTSNIRDLIYEPLSLPSLRVLFLKFPVYGTTEAALRTWSFVSLDILSLDLRIARFWYRTCSLDANQHLIIHRKARRSPIWSSSSARTLGSTSPFIHGLYSLFHGFSEDPETRRLTISKCGDSEPNRKARIVKFASEIDIYHSSDSCSASASPVIAGSAVEARGVHLSLQTRISDPQRLVYT